MPKEVCTRAAGHSACREQNIVQTTSPAIFGGLDTHTEGGQPGSPVQSHMY